MARWELRRRSPARTTLSEQSARVGALALPPAAALPVDDLSDTGGYLLASRSRPTLCRRRRDGECRVADGRANARSSRQAL